MDASICALHAPLSSRTGGAWSMMALGRDRWMWMSMVQEGGKHGGSDGALQNDFGQGGAL